MINDYVTEKTQEDSQVIIDGTIDKMSGELLGDVLQHGVASVRSLNITITGLGSGRYTSIYSIKTGFT